MTLLYPIGIMTTPVHDRSLHESANYSEKGTFPDQTRVIATFDPELSRYSPNQEIR